MDQHEKTMYYGAVPHTLRKANLLRKKMTPSEKILWNKLNKKQIYGVTFRRQHPIDKYIVDFYCHQAKLVIELDGETHLKQKEYDKNRDSELIEHGLLVLRFKNEQVIDNINSVVQKIKKVVVQRLKKNY